MKVKITFLIFIETHLEEESELEEDDEDELDELDAETEAWPGTLAEAEGAKRAGFLPGAEKTISHHPCVN